MATREDVYQKFGITAEATQLFETELSSLIIGTQGLVRGWHKTPDPKQGKKLLKLLDRQTMGKLLQGVKESAGIDDDTKNQFTSALKARNRLFHGFFERHNFRIETDEGRDLMIADLEQLHDELFKAWQTASSMAASLFVLMAKLKAL